MMSVRSVLNNFNKVFLIFGVGSIKYSQSNFKISAVFYVLRCILIYEGLNIFYRANLWVLKIDPEMSELTSLVMISCTELTFIGKFMCHIGRMFSDTKFSTVLTKLETIHEKLIHLNLVGLSKIKTNWFFIIGINIVKVIIDIITPTVWMIIHNQHFHNIKEMVTMMVFNTCQCIVFYEYILLIAYIKWIVYKINEQIPERTSCLSTFRDMYLEVIECLNEINKSIFGLPAILTFIATNFAEIINIIYCQILFPRDFDDDKFFVFTTIGLSTRTANILILYMIGHATEKEVNRMSFVLHQRSVIEKNPIIKRQIKFFLLRRLHEHFHFQLYGMCYINVRQLLIVSNSAIGYLVIQILFKLNK